MTVLPLSCGPLATIFQKFTITFKQIDVESKTLHQNLRQGYNFFCHIAVAHDSATWYLVVP